MEQTKIIVNNYDLNKKHFENLQFKGKRKLPRHEQEMLIAWVDKFCRLTSRVDYLGLIFDLNETYINEDNYFLTYVEFITFCFDIVENVIFYNKRVEYLLKKYLQLEKEIESIKNKMDLERIENGIC